MIKPKSVCSWQKHYTGNSEHLRGFNCVIVYQIQQINWGNSLGETHFGETHWIAQHLSWMFPPYGSQSVDLCSKSIKWFRYGGKTSLSQIYESS